MLTFDELREIMLTCGTEIDVDLAGDIADTEMSELGFDSLAMLHIAAQITRRTRVSIPDDVALDLKTPGALLSFVNAGSQAEVGQP